MQEELDDVIERLAGTERQLQLQTSEAMKGRLEDRTELDFYKVRMHCKRTEKILEKASSTP